MQFEFKHVTQQLRPCVTLIGAVSAVVRKSAYFYRWPSWLGTRGSEPMKVAFLFVLAVSAWPAGQTGDSAMTLAMCCALVLHRALSAAWHHHLKQNDIVFFLLHHLVLLIKDKIIFFEMQLVWRQTCDHFLCNIFSMSYFSKEHFSGVDG